MAEKYTRITEEDEEDGGKKDPFESFVEASNLLSAFESFEKLCASSDIVPFENDHTKFYETLKTNTSNWKAQELWKEIDKRANRKEYNKGKACVDTKVFIIGAGPCGLRTAIELSLLGAKVVLIEKRDRFTRNNVLYLWPYLVTDLMNLGAKKLYGRFGAGDINHISIIKLQTILLKVALILGVEIHHSVEFIELDEKPKKLGWTANLKPKNHKASKFEFNYIIAADGRQHTLPGFEWKESARKLAIGITTNYVNEHSQADAATKEIPGKSYIYDQEFFQGLKSSKNIDLENIVYYKDETHYFVMTAKKTSLLERDVIKKDEADTSRLLAPGNINNNQLQKYAYEAAYYATNELLPTDKCAPNYKGQPDIAMFDFTSRKQAKQAAIIRETDGKVLVMSVVGDSLKEPFWPEGTGCALGFLGVFDTVWMIRDIATGERTKEEALKTREVVCKLLSNTKPEDLNKDFAGYGIDPRTRYTSQVAKSKELYKEEPKKEVILRTNSSTDLDQQPKRRPVSEIIRKDREEHPYPVRARLKTFSPEGTRSNYRKRQSGVTVEKKDQGSSVKEMEKKSFKQKKDEKQPKEGTQETDEEKEKKLKEEKKRKEREEKAKEKQKQKEKKKKEKAREKEEKKTKKDKKDEKATSNETPEEEKVTNRPLKQRGGKSIKERKAELENREHQSKQQKIRSLDRRGTSFKDAKKRFEIPPKPEEESPVKSIASTDQEEEDGIEKKKTGSIWKALQFWKRSKIEDETDSKKKRKRKLRLGKKVRRMTKRGKKNKISKKRNKSKQADNTGSYEKLGGSETSIQGNKTSEGDMSASSSTSNLGNKSSVKSRKNDEKEAMKVDKVTNDEADGLGSKKQKYDKMSDSDERIPKRTKSERSSSFLNKLRPKKRKNSKYNSLQMEVERPIGS